MKGTTEMKYVYTVFVYKNDRLDQKQQIQAPTAALAVDNFMHTSYWQSLRFGIGSASLNIKVSEATEGD